MRPRLFAAFTPTGNQRRTSFAVIPPRTRSNRLPSAHGSRASPRAGREAALRQTVRLATMLLPAHPQALEACPEPGRRGRAERQRCGSRSNTFSSFAVLGASTRSVRRDSFAETRSENPGVVAAQNDRWRELSRLASFPQGREQDHFADGRVAGEGHDQPVDADAKAG